MKAGEQFDIFDVLPSLDERFEALNGTSGTQEHAQSVMSVVQSEGLYVEIREVKQECLLPFRVTVVDSHYCLNGFNCLRGARQFVARHGLLVV